MELLREQGPQSDCFGMRVLNSTDYLVSRVRAMLNV